MMHKIPIPTHEPYSNQAYVAYDRDFIPYLNAAIQSMLQPNIWDTVDLNDIKTAQTYMHTLNNQILNDVSNAMANYMYIHPILFNNNSANDLELLSFNSPDNREYWYDITPTQNSVWGVTLTVTQNSVYKVMISMLKSENIATFLFKLDGVTFATIDGYAAALTPYVGVYTLPDTGDKSEITITISNPTKNALSSGYYILLNSLYLWKA